MEILGYIGAIFIGVILGLTGGGGSIITVPLLIYILGINPVIASAYSLFIVGTTSTFGSFINYTKNLINIKLGFIYAIPSFTAVYLTRKYIVPVIPEIIYKSGKFVITKDLFLILFFATIMFLAALSMIKVKKKTTDTPRQKSSFWFLIPINFVIGCATGLVGAGGGFLITPALIYFTQISMRNAVATSLFIISMNSIIGFLGDVQNVSIDWFFLLKFTLLSIIGINLGIFLSRFLKDGQLKRMFGYFVLTLSIIIFIKEMINLLKV
ncbi:sulfite exporter TauE/SafE family protein [Flavobacterium agricola]|uniref:Probable membrane transporter protein n=1 Tax=Flavobacterium agricola TaxID=2870839 RepID=A0ABY6M3F2_9FLAO|nr:sulfite exporter TauE/SafE family protein [Flavobacterium agricola]UYW01523.1 sulfite exporter TauE/SafE family protein [Flavobacterium agricola]